MNNDEKDATGTTTTPTGWGSGHPRLLISSQGARFVSELLSSETTIGGDSTCSIRLPELRPQHATIMHNENDEYVLSIHDEEPEDSGAGPRPQTEVLRAGTTFEVGPWSFLFSRDAPS